MARMQRWFDRLCRKRARRATEEAKREHSERLFEQAVEQLCRTRERAGGARFLQIGANDGCTNDPLHSFIIHHRLPGFCLEPLPAAFELLQRTYANSPTVVTAQVAIGTGTGSVDLYMAGLPENATTEQWLDATRKATFSKSTAVRKTRKMCGLDNDAEAEERLQRVQVPVQTLADFVEEHGSPHIDILQIDAEGEDWNVLQQAEKLPWPPTLINLEHKGLSPSERDCVQAWFAENGYFMFEHGRDTCGIRYAVLNL